MSVSKFAAVHGGGTKLRGNLLTFITSSQTTTAVRYFLTPPFTAAEMTTEVFC